MGYSSGDGNATSSRLATDAAASDDEDTSRTLRAGEANVYATPQAAVAAKAEASTLPVEGFVQSPTFDDATSNEEQHAETRRVPYFRYFGPTAIIPGYKQMIVSVRDHRRSSVSVAGLAGASPRSGDGDAPFRDFSTMSVAGSEARVVPDIPIYDATDDSPVSPLIKHLVETFFVHLGCNFPFLRRERFIQQVVDKKAETILVDAVCGLSARFSEHSLLTTSNDPKRSKADHGKVFAQRAKSAVIDTFPCPTVAATQACLLLAYESFGAGQDSALWMYLGCAIRMAVDLGLTKLDGVKGQNFSSQASGVVADPDSSQLQSTPIKGSREDESLMQAVEQERSDTFWAVFVLDRIISTGTGRPVTLKDEDLELPFPEITNNVKTGWPTPFPAFIQIINLYGKVSDQLNNVRDAKDLTDTKMQVLAGMEDDLTKLYQRLDHRLNFNAANFQHYVKSGEGTTFILLHFWFHTLIILLHQPMLLHSFEGRIHQLLPNSRELSMSSAKTVADILAFAELIDPKSFIGSPFTTQPIYIAAYAFLVESTGQTASPSSGEPTPTDSKRDDDSKQAAKHTLLAAAAHQNYQKCHRALQQVQTYWSGTKYIITALDQRAKGVENPETFTKEEMESTRALARPDVSSEWKRKLRHTLTSKTPGMKFSGLSGLESESAVIDANQNQAIGWSLTGTTNSPSSNLAFLYQSITGAEAQPTTPSGNMVYDPIRQSLPEFTQPSMATSHESFAAGRPLQADYLSHSSAFSNSMPPPLHRTQSATSDADLLLGLQQTSSYPQHGIGYTRSPSVSEQNQTMMRPSISSNHSSSSLQAAQSQPQTQFDPFGMALSMNGFGGFGGQNQGLGGLGDMMIESQDIDMSVMGNEFSPWLEYMPHDVMGWHDSPGQNGTGKEGWQ